MPITLFLSFLMLATVGLPAAPSHAHDAKKFEGVFLTEEEVSIARLKELADIALLDAEVDSDGDLRITDGGVRGYITVTEKGQWLRFLCVFGFRDGTEHVAKLKLANLINQTHKLSRSYVTKRGRLGFDYYLSYKSGVGSYQVLYTYRSFLQYTAAAIRKQDVSDIVK